MSEAVCACSKTVGKCLKMTIRKLALQYDTQPFALHLRHTVAKICAFLPLKPNPL